MKHVVSLAPADRGEATTMLVRAFAHDPLMHHLFGESPGGVDHGIALLMDVAFETRSSRGWPVLGLREADGRLLGVAYLSVPSAEPSLAGAAASAEPPSLYAARLRFEREIGASGRERYRDYEQAWTVGAPTRPHHYLGVLGVAPDAQGQGAGRTLLDAVAAIVDPTPASEGTWLDTENPRNVGFYERHGFRVAAERSLGGITIWGMWRPRG